MNNKQLNNLINELLLLPAETECLEFKEAKNSYDFNKLGKYFSALSNEANLKNRDCAWLIFGIENIHHNIVGSAYRSNRKDLDSLKKEIADQTNNGISFIEIHELTLNSKRIIMFQIPPAPQGIPTSWKGHFYGRHNESLEALSLQELEQIRNQFLNHDWSADIVQAASIIDLDPAALKVARGKFKDKNSAKSFASDIDSWDDKTFLDKAKITINGQITRTAIILLGREEAVHYISPAVAEITWKLEAEERAYEHFGPPFILNTNALFSKIRNIKFKIQPYNQLIPIELTKYDPWIILEALHNCIAHQDYSKNSRILVTEKIDRLILQNAGSFFEGSLEDYILQDITPRNYRNKFLAQAMVNLDMIDTMGYGIKTMFIKQRQRYFPMPEYDLTQPEQVNVEIMGRLIDENYSKLLIEEADLPLSLVLMLDKVQKQKTLTNPEIKELRKKKLIEGRAPNVHVAAHIAALINNKVQYTKNKAFDTQYYKDLVLKFLDEHGEGKSAELQQLLTGKLSDLLSDDQKKRKVNNILYSMSNIDKTIFNAGGRGKYAIWEKL
jgi:ATP-dependent DNA helicase RecG